MSDLVWIVYVIDTVLGFVTGVGGVLVAISIVMSLALGISYLICSFDDELDKWKSMTRKPIKFVLLPSVFIALLCGLIPSQYTAYKMLAVYGATELAQLEEMQEIGGKSLEVINKVMDDYLAEGE